MPLEKQIIKNFNNKEPIEALAIFLNKNHIFVIDVDNPEKLTNKIKE
jgi:hypothetical protein